MKITIISHDVWGFGKHIYLHIQKLNLEATYINCMEFKYKHGNIIKRATNFFSKTFLNKNIKKIHRTNKIIQELEKLKYQDFILVINSGDFDPKVFDLAKTKTKSLITYNYDSFKRVPLTPYAFDIFEKIYSFDSEDVKENDKLIKINNFIYTPKYPLKEKFTTKAFIVLSRDKKRNIIISKIADQFDKNGYSGKYEFIIIDKKNEKLNKNLFFTDKNVSHNVLQSKIENTEIMIDIVRENQTGLSFRVFESLAHQKKLIINNPIIKNYPFYNPNNILIIDTTNPQIPLSFLETKYEPIDDDIYNKFTINSWVNTVFELENNQRFKQCTLSNTNS
jgi:hypothetical protein